MDDPESEPLVRELWPFYLQTVERERGYYPSTTEVMAVGIALGMNIKIVDFGSSCYEDERVPGGVALGWGAMQWLDPLRWWIFRVGSPKLGCRGARRPRSC